MNYNTTLVAIFISIIYGCSRGEFEANDIYVDRLVYLKRDNSLFTGTLKVVDEASYYKKTFCKGIPCGEWGEREKDEGPFVAKGEYLAVKEILSESTVQALSNNTVIINYWQEGGDLPSDPRHLTVIILKEDAFFESDKSRYKNHINPLVSAVMDDTRSLEYDYFEITFVNAVHDWSRDYSKRYDIKKGKHLENIEEKL